MQVGDDDECNIIYSSGTTGLPKGIVHSHRRRLDWAYDLALALRYHCGARTLCSLGLYSNISWVGFLCTMLAGGTVVVMRAFEPRKLLEIVQRERVTHGAMVPLQFQRILDLEDLGRFDLSSLQSLMCCGSQLPAQLKACRDRAPGMRADRALRADRRPDHDAGTRGRLAEAGLGGQAAAGHGPAHPRER